jgi:predicted dehydrogenase
MVRAAIIGCGKIADQHVQVIRRIQSAAVVAVCDREPLMARQLAERMGIPGCFADVDEMLTATKPDVVHITTPPQSHSALASRCLATGSHVYVEKPFTVTSTEAESVIARAKEFGRHITVGHNYQFTREMLEMRRLVTDGDLGDRIVHLESHWSYDLGDASYVGPILSSREHWVRQLPGQLHHNLISHGVARLVEFLVDPIELMHASAYQSERLKGLGGDEVRDELRVLLRDHTGTTAFFCFTTQVKPGLNRLRLYGPRNSITVDLASGSVYRHSGRNYKSYLVFVAPPIVAARQHLANAVRNTVSIARKRLYQESGMQELIQRFYESFTAGGTLPIPYRDILVTARVMDSVFAELGPATGISGEVVVRA